MRFPVPKHPNLVNLSIFETISEIPRSLDTWAPYIIGSSFIGCFVIYGLLHLVLGTCHGAYRKLSTIKKVEYLTRVVSTLHAAIVFSLALHVMIADGSMWADPVFDRHRDVHSVHLMMSIAVGYFAADLCMILYFWLEPVVPMILHHSLAGFGFLGGLGMCAQFSWFGAALALSEGSTPFTNNDWFFSDVYPTVGQSFVGKLNRVLLLLSWLFFRILLNPFLAFRFYQHWDEVCSANGYQMIVIGSNVVWLALMNNVYFWVSGPFRGYARELWTGKKEGGVKGKEEEEKKKR
jgi:hypothetical protein